VRTLLRLSLPFSAIEKVFFVCFALRGYRNTLNFSFEEHTSSPKDFFALFSICCPQLRESAAYRHRFSTQSRTEDVKSFFVSLLPKLRPPPKKFFSKKRSSEFLTRKHTADTTLSLSFSLCSLSLSMLFAHERRAFLFRKEERRR
jgi:hypothetical protein